MMTIEYKDLLTDKLVTASLHFEDDCYYEVVSKYQYREYFCRDQGEKKFIAVPKSYQDKPQ